MGGYRYWNVTLGARHGPALLELSRIGTDATARNLFGVTQAGERVVLSLTVQLARR